MQPLITDFNFINHDECIYYGDLDNLIEYIYNNKILSVYKRYSHMDLDKYEFEFEEYVDQESPSFIKYMLKDSLLISDNKYFYILDHELCKVIVYTIRLRQLEKLPLRFNISNELSKRRIGC